MDSSSARLVKRARVCRLASLLLLLGVSPLARSAPGDTELISVNPATGKQSGQAMFAETGPTDAVSAGGRYVIFAAPPSTMGDGDEDRPFAIYLRDRYDHTTTVVSCAHGRPVAGSARPPHRSTTCVPSSVMHTEAPTSARSAKLRSNSVRTRSKAASHEP